MSKLPLWIFLHLPGVVRCCCSSSSHIARPLLGFRGGGRRRRRLRGRQRAATSGSSRRLRWPCSSVAAAFGMLLSLLVFVALIRGTLGLQILQVNVPRHIRIGQRAELTCSYELNGDQLYAVQWYKGQDEFYRFVPKDKPPGQVFNVTGVLVNQSESNDTLVVLEDVRLTTSGYYRCEVSAEAPSFRTETAANEMMVVDPPELEPEIIGGRKKYRVGDTVHVNCSAPRSSPPATLEWIVNNKKVDDHLLRDYPPKKYRDGKQASTLGLEFQVTENHFLNGSMTLKCMATVDPFYFKINQQSIMGDHLTASVLESKGSFSDVRNGQNKSGKLYHSHLWPWIAIFILLCESCLVMVDPLLELLLR